jgi:acetyl esterase/lipase
MTRLGPAYGRPRTPASSALIQGGYLQDMFGPPSHYPDSQPIDFVHTGAPPMLLVHGLKDRTVAPKNSRNLAAALSASGVPATLKLYPMLDHPDTVAAMSLPGRGRAPILADIAAFVRPPQPVPPMPPLRSSCRSGSRETPAA